MGWILYDFSVYAIPCDSAIRFVIRISVVVIQYKL